MTNHPARLTTREVIHESVNAAAAVAGRPHRHNTTGWIRSAAHAVMKRTHCPLIVVPDS